LKLALNIPKEIRFVALKEHIKNQVVAITNYNKHILNERIKQNYSVA
jgi:hypothetical protein